MEKRDTSYRDSIATKLNLYDYVDKKVVDERNQNKSWEFRKYPEYDKNFIVISKDGTVGDLIQVGGLILATPKVSELMNKDVHPDKAKWKRTEIPKEFLDLENWYSEQIAEVQPHKRKEIRDKYKKDRLELLDKYKKFVDIEYHRRKYGLHIKIDEEIFYMTGSAYMFFNYYYLTDSNMYPLFRTTAIHTWQHWAGVQADTDVYGELRFKSRRVAWTSEASSEALNELTLTRYANIPIVSERKELAEELFQTKIVDPFKYYPTYFKPILSNPNDLAKSKLEIVHNTAKRETARIKPFPTKVTAYDSIKVNPFAINDEVFKLLDVDFTAFRARHKYCYNKSLSVNPCGKFGSTVGDKAVNTDTATYEWNGANPLERDKTGSTKTKLISLFVDSCYTNAEDSMFDEWGYPIVNDPIEHIKNEVGNYVGIGAVSMWLIEEQNAKELSKTELNSFYRNKPRTIEHALRSEGGIHNNFNIDNLNNHLDYLNDMTDYEKTQAIFTGNFAWEGKPYESKVIWKPDPKGRFQTTWLPDKDLQNKHHRINFHGKQMEVPSNNHIGVFFCDPYNTQGEVEDGSKGAITGYIKQNGVGAPSHSFFLKYLERPPKRETFYDDAIMVSVYYGFYMLIENNKGRILEHFLENGFTGYSMRRPDVAWKHLKPHEKLLGGIPSTKQGNDDQASLLQDYIEDFIGVNLDTEHIKCYFPEIIKEWMIFNVNKRKKFDLGVTTGGCLLASQYNPKQRKALSNDIIKLRGLSLDSFGA